MSPSTDEDETASSDREDDDEDDGDDSDPTAHRERIRRNHVWAIISLLEEQAKGSYHLMVSQWIYCDDVCVWVFLLVWMQSFRKSIR